MHSRYVRSCQLVIELAALSLFVPVALAQSEPAAVSPASSAPLTAVPAVQADEAASFSMGLVLGNQLFSSGLEHSLTVDALMRGLQEGLAGKQPGPQDRERAMQLLRAGREAVAQRNRTLAGEFLTKNGVAPGVRTTASGLQYQVIADGDPKAATPTANDRVTVHYRGRLLDGTEFDNSDDHAQAATFSLKGVLKGWREALMLMKPGAKWRLFIPPELAYGSHPPPAVPPGSLLIYDLELVKVEPQSAAAGQGEKALPSNQQPHR